jgi:hypothetical protein
MESKVSLDSISCVADQGSELNVIDPVLVSLLGLPVLSLSNTGKHGLVINTADGKSTPLSLYVRLTFGAIGIWRTIECFVRPGIKGDIALLLGLPWLHSVKAVIYVQDSLIQIGDPKWGEEIRSIQTPLFSPSQNQKLLLVLGAPEYQAKVQLTKQVIETALRRPITKHNPTADLNTATDVLYSNNNTNSLTESVQGTVSTETNDTTDSSESDTNNTDLTDSDDSETSDCTAQSIDSLN